MLITPDKLPYLPKLAKEYMTDYQYLDDFFNADYRDLASYIATAEKIQSESRRHLNELSEILAEQNLEMGCNKKTMENIKKLPQAFAVVTGQQVGLFSGPLYTIYKILTTIKLSDRLTEALKSPVLPIFYLVSEDHDFKEVQWAGIMENNRFRKIIYEAKIKDRIPVNSIQLNETINILLDTLVGSLPETEFKNDILSSLKDCYKPGHYFHTAFAQWIMKLFKDDGIILCDASDFRVKKLALPIFEMELSHNITANTLHSVNKKLEKKGYHPQIKIQMNRPSIAFIHNGRHSIELRDKQLINLADNSILEKTYLLENIEKLSPKVAFRPIVQDYLFSTIAYVAGPGEISYWAQLKEIYEKFSISMPVVYPRHGFTLVEPKIKRFLSRFVLDPSDFIQSQGRTMETVKQTFLPPNVQETIQKIQTDLKVSFESLDKETQVFDPSLKSVVEKTKNNIIFQLNNMENKVIRALEAKENIISQQLTSITEHLLPEKQLQERQLNIVYYLCKYGFDIFKIINDKIDIFQVDHQIVEL